MAAFACAADLEARWRALSPGEVERAGALLEDASAVITAELARTCAPDPPPALLEMVCCSMVRRSMAGGDAGDVAQQTVTAGSFSQSLSFANPTGALYLTADERRLLGIPKRRQRMAFLSPWGKETPDDGR